MARTLDGYRVTPALFLWAANILLGVLLSFSFFGRISDAPSVSVGLFGVFALLSSIGILSLGPGLLSVLLCKVIRGPLQAWALALCWTIAILVLFIDTRLHGFYGYHINSTVMAAIFTPGIEQSVSVGWGEILPLIFIVLGLVPAQAWLVSRRPMQKETRWSLGIITGSLLGFLVLPLLESAAGPDFKGSIAERADAIPGPNFADPMGVYFTDLEKRALLDIPAPDLPEDAPSWNILVVVLDCLRADALSPGVSPRIHAFAEDARQFQNHMSGGNWTQHGIFSLIYGWHGSYWKPTLKKKAAPPLLRTLKKAGYDFRISAAAAQTFPAFRDTAWVEIQEDVYDQFPGESPWKRDEQAVHDFSKWLQERETTAPFFSFFLLDSTHQVYSFPPDNTPFTPFEETIRYLPISYGTDTEQRERIRNRYRNAIHYADGLVGQILDSLSENGLKENTLVVITGDHGEEFWEHGIWGHSTNFSKEQVYVPFLVQGPTVSAGIETRPTSHLDFSRTILEWLGVSPSFASEYSLGENMFRPKDHRTRVAGGWQGLALHDQGHIIFLPSPEGGRTSVYTENWERLNNPDAVLKNAQPAIQRLQEECARFLAPALQNSPPIPPKR